MSMGLIYNEEGQALRAIEAPISDISLNTREGEDYLLLEEIPDLDAIYVLDGQVATKTSFPGLVYPASAAPGAIRIDRIPVNTLVIWPDRVQTRETDGLIVDIDLPGLYVFTFVHPAYYPQEVTIHVTP